MYIQELLVGVFEPPSQPGDDTGRWGSKSDKTSNRNIS